ncbi:MAG: RHS repeat-associated core domain-containing protein [Isosphaeraceae bacterium]
MTQSPSSPVSLCLVRAGLPSVTLTSGYDQNHDRTTLADNLSSAGLTTFSYDPAFRLTTIAASYGGTAGPQVDFGYDPGNRLTSISRTIGGSGTEVNTTIAYDAANRLTTITDQAYTPGGSGGGTTTPLATYAYGYDNANRVTTEVNAEGTVTYSYDSGGELLTARGSRTEDYSYDSGGNRNSSGYTTGTGNELTASPGYTYTYDAEGNMTAQTNTSTHVTTSYSYDNRNRLTQVTVGGTVVATYTYDALNQRIGFKDNGTQTWTVYDGTSADANPYADFNGSGNLLTRYMSTQAVDDILARTSSGGATAWYLKDRLGSVRDVVSTSGTVIDHVVYDSYGDILSETSPSNGDRFKFTGMEWDAAIGQYYDHARDYDAAAGRFTSQDPLGFAAGDRNLYRYVYSDPVNLTDLQGTASDDPTKSPGPNMRQNDYDRIMAYVKAMKAANDEMVALLSRQQKKYTDEEMAAFKAAIGISKKWNDEMSKKYNAMITKQGDAFRVWLRQDFLRTRSILDRIGTLYHEMWHADSRSYFEYTKEEEQYAKAYGDVMKKLFAQTEAYKRLQAAEAKAVEAERERQGK